MATGDIKIEGLSELNNKFSQIQKLEQEVQQGLRKGAEIIRGDAVLRCPVNHGELRSSIHTKVKKTSTGYQGIVFTNKDYAPYVEFGTGPVGEAHHSGVSPKVSLSYRSDSWWIPEDCIDPADAERYHWPKYTNKQGKSFYLTSGQPAQPYLYPAMKTKESAAVKAIQSEVSAKLKKISEG